MDSYQDIMTGTTFGEVVIPGSSIPSLLYLLVAGKAGPSITMPHGEQPLSKEDIQIIKVWMEQGAKNP